jgi:hypothetical protein
MTKIDELCDELESLSALRPKAAADVEAADRALADIDAKMAAKKVEVARAMQDELKRLGCDEGEA